MDTPNIIPVILCGGYGTRLWPLSNEQRPKQFLKPHGVDTMLNITLQRALNYTNALPEHVITVTLDEFSGQVYEELLTFGPNAACHLLREPCAKNTAAAIAYAALYAEINFDPQSILWVMPSDHLIEEDEELERALGSAARAAKDGYITTFGMAPHKPDTAFGYIKPGKLLNKRKRSHKVDYFTEKPDRETASFYMDQGYLWNSGMFVFKTETLLDEYEDLCPEILKGLYKAFASHQNFHNPDIKIYNRLPKIPFDIAIMEKTSRAAVVPCDLDWTDIGSWERLTEAVQFANNDNPPVFPITKRV